MIFVINRREIYLKLTKSYEKQIKKNQNKSEKQKETKLIAFINEEIKMKIKIKTMNTRTHTQTNENVYICGKTKFLVFFFYTNGRV